MSSKETRRAVKLHPSTRRIGAATGDTPLTGGELGDCTMTSAIRIRNNAQHVDLRRIGAHLMRCPSPPESRNDVVASWTR